MRGKKPNHGRGTALAESPPRTPQGTQIKGRLWLEKDGEIFLSWGRVVLLEHIREGGSIAAAARSLNMAYSHAWTLVATMNRLAGGELVSRTFGGRHGGRAWLTPLGEATIAKFWDLAGRFREWLENRQEI
jgi:molybdate transport system regulatory protein